MRISTAVSSLHETPCYGTFTKFANYTVRQLLIFPSTW